MIDSSKMLLIKRKRKNNFYLFNPNFIIDVKI